LLDALVRSCLVEVGYIGTQNPLELPLMQDEQMVEALTSHTAEEALTDGIRSRGVIRRCENFNATRLGNPREDHSKLAIVITDEVLRPHTKGSGLPKRYAQSKRRWAIASRRHGSLGASAVRP